MKRLFLLLLLCASSAFAQDLRPSAYLGLPGKITVRGGKILGASGGVTTIAEQTLTPANSATTYVYIDLSGTPAVATSTSAFPSSSYFPICVVTKDANGVITAFTDSRPDSFMAGGGGVSTGSSVSFTVSPMSYGAKWDVKIISDGATTNGSSTYTCPNADCSFTSADLGKLFIAVVAPASATPPCDLGGCGSVLGQGFICTINSATSVAVGATFPGCAAVNAAATCATSANGNCNFAWGTQDDSTAINSAATAAWNNGNKCFALELPAGNAFFSSPIMNVTPNAGSPCAGYGGVGNGPGFADFMQVGPQVYGQGPGATILIPYNFNFAACTFGASSKACTLATPSIYAHDFQISGLGQADSGTTHNVNLTEFRGVGTPCTSTSGANLSLNGWEASSTSAVGFAVTGGCVTLNFSNIVSEMFGTTPCSFSGQIVNLNGIECFGSGGARGTGVSAIFNATLLNSTSGFFGNVNPLAANNEAIQLTNTAVWNSFGDKVILGDTAPTNGLTVLCNAACTAVLTGTTIDTNPQSAGAAAAIACLGAPCNIKTYGSAISASGTNAKLFLNTGTLNLFDACGNTFTQGGAASSAINTFGACSITGTPITSAKLVLSAGWGASAAWTALTGATQSVQGTITNTGAGQAANPTITYTFPTPFVQAPAFCSAYQVGGTQAILAATEFLTPSALSATGVTFTYNGTPTVNLTEVIQILCSNQ